LHDRAFDYGRYTNEVRGDFGVISTRIQNHLPKYQPCGDKCADDDASADDRSFASKRLWT